MKGIQEIKEALKAASEEELPGLMEVYAKDTRKGVQTALIQAQKRLDKLEQERQRIETMKAFERKYEHLGYVCGIDEVGRGPFAGPVVAGAVILPKDCHILYINDSKQLSEKKREELLNDAVTIPGITIPQVPIIKGDAKSISIAAASIIAKVTRDRLMKEYDKIMPEYGFASNKGYGSREHIEALKQYGPTAIHRKTFIRNVLGEV